MLCIINEIQKKTEICGLNRSESLNYEYDDLQFHTASEPSISRSTKRKMTFVQCHISFIYYLCDSISVYNK